MSDATIKLIQSLIENTFREGQSIPLHQLLWTVDAQHHLIVSAEEVNQALQACPPVRIERQASKVTLLPSSDSTEDKITNIDIADATEVYNNQLSQFIAKHTKIKSRRSKPAK